MSQECQVTFKGTVNGLTMILQEADPFEAIENTVMEKVTSASRFFKGASLHVRYRGKQLDHTEESRLLQILEKYSGAEIRSFEKDSEEVRAEEAKPSAPKFQMKNYMFFKGIEEGETLFHRGTVRSGQLIRAKGNLVVIGDVNPGAELVAPGNVMVMGSLRGVVHAGSDGNKDAVIVALNLQPTQLRIAEVITRPPDDHSQRANFIPEIAMVREENVIIERYLPQR